jgi:hypothetical protein
MEPLEQNRREQNEKTEVASRIETRNEKTTKSSTSVGKHPRSLLLWLGMHRFR